MVAHEVIGGGVAQRIGESSVEPFKSVNMMAIQPISALSPGRSNCSGQSRRKAGMAITRSPVSASWAQLDPRRRTQAVVALVADRELIPAVRPFKQDIGAACYERRDDPVFAVLG